MAGKKASGENSKKASGNAKKAEAAAQKAAQENAKKAVEEDSEWAKGAKSNAKKEAEAAKKAEAARKKAEKDAILAEEEKEARAVPKNAKTAPKKSKGLDLSQLDDEGPKKEATALNATGIDNALDALSLTAGSTDKIDKHPERRFKAAFAAFEERRLKEMDEDGSGQGLRQNQKREKIRKEFEKSEDNPFNQVSARYDASKDELKELREQEKAKIEARLGEK
jgi:hypothetical protein